jgi:hypothetical protein
MAEEEILVNITTGERMTADPDQLRELKMPRGFKLAEDVKLEEWLMLVGSLYDRIHNYRSYGASSDSDFDAE